ncbi:MAG: hypothetical protein E7544_07970 [Ruminococcaceae bacterium]|nr:hypothetical protein [Oscillospiraceae bacterium]
MKSYKEMSDSVIERVKAHKEKQKRRKEAVKKISAMTSCIIMVGVISLGVAVLIRGNTRFKTEAEIFRDEYNVSNNLAAEEKTKTSVKTTKSKKKPTKRPKTTKKETTVSKTTEKDVVLQENTEKTEPTTETPEATTDMILVPNQIDPEIEMPVQFEQEDKMIYYYDGISGGYPRIISGSIRYELTSIYFNEWIETDAVGTDNVIDNIKNNGRAVEFLFESTQYIKFTLTDKSERTFRFDRVLFVLNGEYQQVLFFGYNGTYSAGALKTTKTHTVETALSSYQEELLEFN